MVYGETFLRNFKFYAKTLTKLHDLTVVGNEKGGGSGGWLLFEDVFGPWRSMSVYF